MVVESGPVHLCRQGRRCKDSVATAEGDIVAAGVERPDALCRACEKHAFSAMGCLWQDYQALEAAITQPRGRIDGPKVKYTATRKIPLPLDIDTLMTAIDDETLRWTLRVTRGEPLPSATRERVRRCVALLGANTGTLVDMPLRRVTAWLTLAEGGDVDGHLELDGVDAVLRLAELHRKAQTILGLTEPPVEKLRDVCHICGCEALTIEIADSVIKCRNCRNCWSETEFARLNSPLAA